MKWILVSVACALLLTWVKVDAKKGKKPLRNNFKRLRYSVSHPSTDWCYHLPGCDETTWPTISQNYCNGSRQSPIDIASTNASSDSKLGTFTFNNYGIKSSMTNACNTGKTIKVGLHHGVSISGGGLAEAYDSLQLHLHWGNGSSVSGSEHTVDGKRYPMELHIVSRKANKHLDQALQDSTGLAALGFFIEEMSGDKTASPAGWKTFSSYLARITEKYQCVKIDTGLSLDDLLGEVDRTKYYRYLGSLTTPPCYEAVVWTVFKEPIKVSKDLIDLFSTTLHVDRSDSELMTNVFRAVQADQPVTTQ